MIATPDYKLLRDPLRLGGVLWPEVTLYKQQREIVRSVWEDHETYVPAANKMGKDFVAAFIVLTFFLTRHPCRIVTTSAGEDHLAVLWGEITRFIERSKLPLDHKRGGPLVINYQHLRKMVDGKLCGISYVQGMVASDDNIAKMQGHHATPEDLGQASDGVPRTLFVSDESSSVKDEYYRMASTWMKRALIFGNTWPCENFFKKGVKGGDLQAPAGNHYRRVIRIRAEDSPNIRWARKEQIAGMEPTGKLLVPGVKDWPEYQKNLATWDEYQRCVSLDAEFYEGALAKLFPSAWLDRAEELARQQGRRPRRAKAVGIDPAEGGDKTAMCAVDERGIIELVSKPTPDTHVVTGEAIAFARRHGVEDVNIIFDRGGGGQEHADRLRAQGFRGVRTVGFGESVSLEPRRGLHQLATRKEVVEERYAYRNRRAQMYGELSQLLDPSLGREFSIPQEYAELRRQLLVFPKDYDEEGRLRLPPKHRRDDSDTRTTLFEMLGRSPDEADALALAVHGMLHKFRPAVARAGG